MVALSCSSASTSSVGHDVIILQQLHKTKTICVPAHYFRSLALNELTKHGEKKSGWNEYYCFHHYFLLYTEGIRVTYRKWCLRAMKSSSSNFPFRRLLIDDEIRAYHNETLSTTLNNNIHFHQKPSRFFMEVEKKETLPPLETFWKRSKVRIEEVRALSIRRHNNEWK